MSKIKGIRTVSASDRFTIAWRLHGSESVSALATEYNVSVRTIRRIASEQENSNIYETDYHSVPTKGINRKPQINLTLQDRDAILKSSEAGETDRFLANKYKVSQRTIQRIKKNKEKVVECLTSLQSTNATSSIKKLSGTHETAINKALFAWFVQKRSANEHVSGTILQEKALQLAEKLGGPSTFRASNGWLDKFKKRHGIYHLSTQSEKLSADDSAAEEFAITLVELIQKNGYAYDQIYNADETGLYWRSLPHEMLATREEQNAAGRKDSKERITVMFCANASGSHRIPLLVIGKSRQPQCFKNVKDLPVKYMGQKSSWMDRTVFMEWYTELFIPEIKKHQLALGTTKKVLLILDNAPSHPTANELNSVDENFEVLYLPLNVKALIQPMDQGVIEKAKRLYKKACIREFLLNQNDVSIFEVAKQQTLKDCCYRIAHVWNLITEHNLRTAWNQILGKDCEVKVTNDECHQETLQVLSIIRRFTNFTNLAYNDIQTWLQEDCGETGWEVLSADRILERLQGHSLSEAGDDELEDDPANTDSSNTSPQEPSIYQALKGLQTFQNWFETNWDCTASDILNLQDLRDRALNLL